MKLTSIFCLGLGMTAAMASGDSYLRVNGSSRQLSDSNQSSGDIFHAAMQRALGPGPPPPPPPHAINSGDGDDGSDEGSDNEDCTCFCEDVEENIKVCYCLETGEDCPVDYEESAESEEPVETQKSWLSWFSGSSTSSSAASGGDGTDDASENTDHDGDDATQEQYFANEYNSGGAGNAQNAGGSSAANVWPFLVAALVVGVLAAALVTLKKVSLALCLYFPKLFAFMSSCVLLTNVVVVYSSKIIEASAN